MLSGIFTNPAFGLETLTDSILQMPYLPTQARATGVFSSDGVFTTTVDLELDTLTMTLVPNTVRGGPITNYGDTKGVMRSLNVPHLPLRTTIKPSEVQGRRLFGSSDQLMLAKDVVAKRMLGMTATLDATLEYQSIGAIKGVIYDADGASVIYNLFNEFQVAQTVVDFTLGDPNSDLNRKLMQVKRAIKLALGAVLAGGIRCFCGDDWFDAFTAHPQVAKAFELWKEDTAQGQYGDFARNDNRSGFVYKGITFENYVGNVAGVNFVPAGEAHFFPTGVPGLFKTVFAPGDFNETANTKGLPRYARGEPLRMGRGLELQVETNPLCYCTRPLTLIKGTTSTYPPGIP